MLSTENAESKKDNLRILIAEDNVVNIKVLRILLDRMGHQYDIAHDGVEAVERYKSNKYDLVLMDCQMPNLDGLAATEMIRSIELSESRRKCPIVAMTANVMMGDRERCLNSGMNDFLAKPFKSQELIKTINTWSLNHEQP